VAEPRLDFLSIILRRPAGGEFEWFCVSCRYSDQFSATISPISSLEERLSDVIPSDIQGEPIRFLLRNNCSLPIYCPIFTLVSRKRSRLSSAEDDDHEATARCVVFELPMSVPLSSSFHPSPTRQRAVNGPIDEVNVTVERPTTGEWDSLRLGVVDKITPEQTCLPMPTRPFQLPLGSCCSPQFSCRGRLRVWCCISSPCRLYTASTGRSERVAHGIDCC
jgi:hypothetical protein